MTVDLDTIMAWAKRNGFVYPGSDIYDGLANAWDMWPYGTLLKKNIEKLWWQEFQQKRDDMLALDAQIFMDSKVWKASGHLDDFSDPLIDCKNCNNRQRVDKMIEAIMEKLRKEKTDEQIQKDFSDMLGVDNLVPESWTHEQMLDAMDKLDINCPVCGANDWTEIREFKLMFETHQGVIKDESTKVYLRPETAQWIFVNFKNVLDTTRQQLPFGIAQTGKAFRNEITPGKFLFRPREFEQMEIEYFVKPWNEDERLEKWKDLSQKWWIETIGINPENIKFRQQDKDELAHYSTGTYDVEYNFPWGWDELQWVASRTDFDLNAHMEDSDTDLRYTDPYTGKKYTPYVIEPSWGLTRAVCAAMFDAYEDETYEDNRWNEKQRTVLHFDKKIAPIKFAIFPLSKKKDEIVDIAKEINQKLSQKYQCKLDMKGSIGKRYRRQDEIWTPFCITVDFDSIEDGSVTIRDRDSMKQIRVQPEELEEFMEDRQVV